ncbi:ABC transporter substrate-binding protein [Conyzicola sp.]|uniref:ABC transporter substrate-binding protein n=1 Tax=Conyzicola sp. TaxID=1969404 RepID=UPI00398914A0
MLTNRLRAPALLAIGLASVLAVSGCSASPAGSGDTSEKTLVIDKSFDLKTTDPARAFELTGSIVDKAIYETALDFEGSDVTTVVPGIATYEENDDNTVLTLTVDGEHTFSDGSPVTADDIVFSYQRVQGIAGNPSFLLDGVTVEKTGDDTVTLTSATPNPALPFILPNPSLGIVNSKVLLANGGSTGADDDAEAFLNETSAGSGPYMLEAYSVTTKVTLTLNPEYAGDKPAYSRVVLENVEGATQKINVQAGAAQIALDLNADQVSDMGDDVNVVENVSPYLIYSWFNQDAAVSAGVTNQPDFLKAVRQGIDYDTILSIAGEGAVQPGGMVPSIFTGALESDPSNVFDLDAAKEALASSGYNGEEVTFSYPNDITVNGLQMQTLAEAIQSQLKDVGITLTLAPGPISTFLDAFRAGTLQSGIMYWGPDFPDPSNYLVFNPGESLGLRAGWAAGTDEAVTSAAAAAAAASGDERVSAYEAWQTAANASGPFVPIVQPGQYAVTTPEISSLELNPVWTIDIADIK